MKYDPDTVTALAKQDLATGAIFAVLVALLGVLVRFYPDPGATYAMAAMFGVSVMMLINGARLWIGGMAWRERPSRMAVQIGLAKNPPNR